MLPMIPKTLKEYNEILDFTYKLYPIALAIFLIFDVLTFQQFGFKTGFLIQVIQDINISSFNIIFLFLMIPFLTVFLLAFGFYISKHLSIEIFNILTNSLKKYGRTITPTDILITILMLFYSTTFCFLLSSTEAVTIYVLFCISQIFLNLLFLIVFSSSLLDKIEKWCIFIIHIIFALIIAFCLTVSVEYPEKFTVITIITAFHFIALFFMHDIPKELKVNASSNSSNYFRTRRYYSSNGTHKINIPKLNSSEQKFAFFFSLLGILFIFYTFYDTNKRVWNLPIKYNNKEEKSMNLIFNRGFLVDMNDDINITGSNKKISKNEQYQYLSIGINYRIFFKNSDNNTSTTVLIVKEKEFVNQLGSEYTLIAESMFSYK